MHIVFHLLINQLRELSHLTVFGHIRACFLSFSLAAVLSHVFIFKFNHISDSIWSFVYQMTTANEGTRESMTTIDLQNVNCH